MEIKGVTVPTLQTAAGAKLRACIVIIASPPATTVAPRHRPLYYVRYDDSLRF